jgi:anti-sigma regulatory factor (Ser/Thr protein kinase)
MTRRVAGTARPTEQAVVRLPDTPPVNSLSFDIALLCEPPSVRIARQACTAWARQQCRLPEPQVGVLKLVVSELCTNAVLHGRCEEFRVCGRMPTYHWVRLEVHDRTPSAVPVPQDAGAEAVCGRGLFLVDAFVSELKGTWGFSPDGSVAWCQVPTVVPCFDVPVEEIDV